MEPRFEQFIQEKKYLANVSPATCEWYKQSLNWLSSPSPDEPALKDFVMRMRSAGLNASSCNCRIRAVNAYLRWAGRSLKVPRMKEELRILPTFSVEDIQKITEWKPKDLYGTRLHVFILSVCPIPCLGPTKLALPAPEGKAVRAPTKLACKPVCSLTRQ